MKDPLFRNSIRIVFKLFFGIPYIFILAIAFPFFGINYFLGVLILVGVGVFEALRQRDGAVLPEDVAGQAEAERSAEAAALDAAAAPDHVT